MAKKSEWIFDHLWMREIVQHYFDTVLLKNANIKVTSVDYRGSPDKQFIARLENNIEEKGS